jgi:NO-binding membrane sensor protein with MHYT domain
MSSASTDPAARLARLRRWVLGVLVVGLIGTETELVLLEHYEEPWQFVPLLLIAFAVAILTWHVKRRDLRSRRALTGLMIAFLVAGFAGLVLHFRGAAEFQLETNPAIGRWDLIKQVMTAKAPPVLAAGAMLQLGLLGLVYTFFDFEGNSND